MRVEREYRPDPERAARALLLLLTKTEAAADRITAPEGGLRDAADPQPANDVARPPLPMA